MTGGRVGDRCAGKSVVVASQFAYFDIKPEDKERVLAIHIGQAVCILIFFTYYMFNISLTMPLIFQSKLL